MEGLTQILAVLSMTGWIGLKSVLLTVAFYSSFWFVMSVDHGGKFSEVKTTAKRSMVNSLDCIVFWLKIEPRHALSVYSTTTYSLVYSR